MAKKQKNRLKNKKNKNVKEFNQQNKICDALKKKNRTHDLYYLYVHALNLPYFYYEKNNKKLPMQIYYGNHCYSCYIPLGVLGVILKLKLKILLIRILKLNGLRLDQQNVTNSFIFANKGWPIHPKGLNHFQFESNSVKDSDFFYTSLTSSYSIFSM